MMHNFIAYVRKEGDFLKSYWENNNLLWFFMNFFTCKLLAWQLLFKTLVGWLDRVDFSYTWTTKTANSKAFTCKLCYNATHSRGLNTWAGLDSSAKVTFIPVLHEKCQPGVASFIYRLEAVCMFLGWFILRAAWQAWLLGKIPARKNK